ncbi:MULTISPECIES: DUF4148 domain-containing protein [unclassified Janthinobacterium]|uniref:DUF4148 domain-containing protein n=1 Tax=unclassified Janthinobacterium TaxID=2610881 RepID=UPI00160B67DB|nr:MULTISPECIES: DUF4148 domain-containing protein [unclassified Janthinobacterium]MBB5369685.1 hypothetical protein [Janthinobacterium sp. K2C7]MBB5382359.1 hypothetical protein [Janthinobacterium sp. K2Li3]MBB5387936.1 hypothetical protein [Janthinobacterium sp. K2E3]
MQAKSVLAALFAITAASSVFAQSAPATKTVSDSQAQYIQARNAGEIPTSVAAYPQAPAAAPSKVTREQVMAEFYAARKAGQIPQTEADFDVAQTRHQIAK